MVQKTQNVSKGQKVLGHPVLSVLDTLSSVVAEGNPEGIICTLLPRSVFQSFVSSLFSIIRFEEMMWKLFLLRCHLFGASSYLSFENRKRCQMAKNGLFHSIFW